MISNSPSIRQSVSDNGGGMMDEAMSLSMINIMILFLFLLLDFSQRLLEYKDIYKNNAYKCYIPDLQKRRELLYYKDNAVQIIICYV